MVAIAREQAESGRRWRRSVGLEDDPPLAAEPPRERVYGRPTALCPLADVIDVADAWRAKVQAVSLWPPGAFATNRITVAIVPISAAPELGDLFPSRDDFYDHQGQPAVILGECKIISITQGIMLRDGYIPFDTYTREEAVKYTTAFRNQQREKLHKQAGPGTVAAGLAKELAELKATVSRMVGGSK
jgi:hypothetical protein